MQLSLDKRGKLYDQVARTLRLEILEGRLVAGSKLPPSRALATALGVSSRSVLRAYDLLRAEGFAMDQGESSLRVASVSRPAKTSTDVGALPTSRYALRLRSLPSPIYGGARVSRPPSYDLLCGESLVDSALFSSWRRKLAPAARRAGPTLLREGGYLPLRRAIANYLGRRRGVICEASDIVMVGGTQQALTIVERVLLNSGDRVVVEDPRYPPVLHSLLAHGALVTSARTDNEGLVVSELPERRTHLTVITPSHQFPSGVEMTLPRRKELLKWAARTGSWIFEDDYNTEFHSGERHLPSLRSLDLADRVLYVGGFSQSLFPSLRLGYVVCRKAIRDDLFNAKLMDDLGSAAMEQAALAAFMQAASTKSTCVNSSERSSLGAKLSSKRCGVWEAPISSSAHITPARILSFGFAI